MRCRLTVIALVQVAFIACGGGDAPRDAGGLPDAGIDAAEAPDADAPDGGHPPRGAASAPLDLGLAGAPIGLFGPADAPTFESAFAQVASAGFDTFFPLFVEFENEEESVYSDHGIFFFAPGLSGAPMESSCAGPHDPYAAAEGRVRIWYPGLQLLGLFDLSQPIADSDLRTALSRQRTECPSSASVAGFYSHDEPSIGRIAAVYLGEPPLLQANVESVARVVRDSWSVPVMTIEIPGEVAIRGLGLEEDETDRLVEAFWADARSIAAEQDAYGFNVYTVPDFPITLAGDHVRIASSVAPTQRIVSVLQGMSFARITRDPTRGRAPTQAEIRFQAIDSVAGGADSLFWYGTSSLDLADPDDARLWGDLGEVATELRAVRDAIMGEPVAIPAVPGLWVRAHRGDEELVVFVSHREPAPARRRLTLGPEWTEVEVVAGPVPTRDSEGWVIEMAGFEAAILRFR